MRKIRLASRGSRLALIQTKMVEQLFLEKGYDTEIIVIKTRGDLDNKNSLVKIGGNGLFVREIEAAVLNGEADLAVHSAKDLPSETAAGLRLYPVLGDSPADCIVHPESISENAIKRIGTGSPRRAMNVRELYPQAQILDIRGNVDTRLSKLRLGDFDAIILAKAGLTRLSPDLSGLVIREFLPQKFIPSPCQGIIAAQCRQEDEEIITVLSKAADRQVNERFLYERGLLCALSANCSAAIGAFADCENDEHTFYVRYNEVKKCFNIALADEAKAVNDEIMVIAGEIKQ